jgi:hypothetical protein
MYKYSCLISLVCIATVPVLFGTIVFATKMPTSKFVGRRWRKVYAPEAVMSGGWTDVQGVCLCCPDSGNGRRRPGGYDADETRGLHTFRIRGISHEGWTVCVLGCVCVGLLLPTLWHCTMVDEQEKKNSPGFLVFISVEL